jgi:hypothetical protein
MVDGAGQVPRALNGNLGPLLFGAVAGLGESSLRSDLKNASQSRFEAVRDRDEPQGFIHKMEVSSHWACNEL